MNKRLIPIFLVVFIDLVGFGIIIPLLPTFATSFGASPLAIGLLTASYSAMQLIGAPVLGRLSDRFGRKPLLIISQLGTFAGFVLMGFANSLAMLFAARILDGFTGGNLSIAQAAIADVTEEKDRAKSYGLIGAAFGLGFILGPAIGGLLSRWGNSVPAFAAAAISAGSVALTIALLPETRQASAAPVARRAFTLAALRQTLSNSVLTRLLGYGLVFNIGFAIFQTTFALFAKEKFGFNVEQTGYMLGYVGILVVIAQVVILPRMVKLVGEQRLIFLGSATLGLGLLGVGMLTPWWALFGTLMLTAFGGGVVNPSLQSLYTRTVSAEERGGVLGLSASVDAFSRIVAPIWGGWILGVAGAAWPALSGALLMLIVLIYGAAALGGAAAGVPAAQEAAVLP